MCYADIAIDLLYEGLLRELPVFKTSLFYRHASPETIYIEVLEVDKMQRITITCQDIAAEIRNRDPKNPVTGDMIRRNYALKGKLEYWRFGEFGTLYIKPHCLKPFFINEQGYTEKEAAEAEASILSNFNFALTA